MIEPSFSKHMKNPKMQHNSSTGILPGLWLTNAYWFQRTQIKNGGNALSLSDKDAQTHQEATPANCILNNGANNIHFTKKIKYLVALIIPELNEEAGIQMNIKTAKAV